MIAKAMAGPALAGGVWSRMAVAAPVFLLGIAIIFIVGFAQPASLHEAAHDTRHAFSFPCH